MSDLIFINIPQENACQAMSLHLTGPGSAFAKGGGQTTKGDLGGPHGSPSLLKAAGTMAGK